MEKGYLISFTVRREETGIAFTLFYRTVAVWLNLTDQVDARL